MENKGNECISNEEDVIEKSFLKMKVVMEKDGYRDGIEEGRQKVFQKYFDEGYFDGLKNGYVLGKLKGEKCAKEFFDKLSEAHVEALATSATGACILCKNEDHQHKTVEEIRKLQSEVLDNLVNGLAT